MNWIYEEPIYAFLSGSLFVAAFIAFAIVTGKKILWLMAALAFVATTVLLIIENRVVTDREALNDSLNALVIAVRSNDLEGILAQFSPRQEATFSQIQSEMPQYSFSSCSLTRRDEPVIDMSPSPPRAKIKFAVFANVNALASSYRYDGPVNRGVTLYYEKEADGVWRIVGYDHYPTGLLGENQAESSTQEIGVGVPNRTRQNSLIVKPVRVWRLQQPQDQLLNLGEWAT